MATMSDDLTARITAALDHAEQVARATMYRTWVEGSLWFEGMTAPDKSATTTVPVPVEDTRHMALWDPNHVLDLIAAHREILAIHARYDQVYPEYPHPDVPAASCVGCNFDRRAMPMVKNVNDCPTLRSVAKAHRIEV